MTTERYVIRTPEGEEEHSAGGVVYRPAGDDFEVLLIHRIKQNDWSLPKGHIEDGESAEGAAIRELQEETGLSGAVTAYIGELRYQITGKSGRPTTKVVYHFLIEADPNNGDSSAEEGIVDEVRWVPLNIAANVVSYDAEKGSIRRAREMLDVYQEWTSAGARDA